MMLGADSRIRIWRFTTGMLRRSFDESMEVRQAGRPGVCAGWGSGYGLEYMFGL